MKNIFLFRFFFKYVEQTKYLNFSMFQINRKYVNQ